MYRHSNENKFPPDLETLIDAGLIHDRKLFRCPAARSGRSCDYFYLAPQGAHPLPDTIIACDLWRNHKGKGRNVLHADGTVWWETEKGFQAELDKPINAAFAAALRAAEGATDRPGPNR